MSNGPDGLIMSQAWDGAAKHDLKNTVFGSGCRIGRLIQEGAEHDIDGRRFHPSFQTIAFVVEETGEYGEQELNHSDGKAEKFCRDLKQRGMCVRVGLEATEHSRWFELAELGFELWIGDPAEIKAKRMKKQKFDREDARLLLRLLRENSFPQIWVPDPENRDLRQLLWHRLRLVQPISDCRDLSANSHCSQGRSYDCGLKSGMPLIFWYK
jgi:hypothetical protein